jgi:hypothetical protein
MFRKVDNSVKQIGNIRKKCKQVTFMKIKPYESGNHSYFIHFDSTLGS